MPENQRQHPAFIGDHSEYDCFDPANVKRNKERLAAEQQAQAVEIAQRLKKFNENLVAGLILALNGKLRDQRHIVGFIETVCGGLPSDVMPEIVMEATSEAFTHTNRWKEAAQIVIEVVKKLPRT